MGALNHSQIYDSDECDGGPSRRFADESQRLRQNSRE